MKTILLTTALILLGTIGYSQYLTIEDPQDWRRGQGTIEETKITYEPKGLFTEVNWEITFSAKGLEEFTEKDTVEVVYYFKLPEGAVVTDSWLWFNDSILTALIIDRWSANQVYENIVNRRKDPSILYKNWGNDYELRIFPMAAKESRKVRLTFLIPTNWTEKKVESYFPAENLMVSKYPSKNVDVYANLTSEWKNPVISGAGNIILDAENGEDFTHHIKIDFKQLSRNQKFEVSSPMKDGIYLNFYENGDEKFYQLALFPGEGMDIQKPQRVLFLVDYQSDNTSISQKELLGTLKSELPDLLNEKDSFNILFYDLELQKMAGDWVSGDSTMIVQAIDGLGDDPFVSYGNLPSLLASGVELAQANSETKIILLANSNKLDNVEAANQLIDDLLELMNPVIPIYIGDFQNMNFQYDWINNTTYTGNEYFYRNLAKLTGGDYIHLFNNGTFSQSINEIYQLATNINGLIDIHTSLDNGFCYGRYILSNENLNILSNIYLETGRFSGDFPFEVEVSGLYSEEIFTKDYSVAKDEAIQSDSLTEIFWYGNEIMKLENTNDYYSVINDIIDMSIDKRILSNYTAFLCLEPGMMGELDEVDEKDVITGEWRQTTDDIAISVETIKTQTFNVSVYPNPFTDKINIEVSVPENVSIENCQMEIYDLFGKRIKVFNPEQFNGNSEIKVVWDATDIAGSNVPKGTYIFICTTPEGKISKKLILM